MSRKRFITKITIRALILTIILIFIVNFLGAADTLIVNELALGQMENSNDAYLLMQLYNNTIKPLCYAIAAIASLVIVVLTATDTYKFLKTINKGETKDENDKTL